MRRQCSVCDIWRETPYFFLYFNCKDVKNKFGIDICAECGDNIKGYIGFMKAKRKKRPKRNGGSGRQPLIKYLKEGINRKQ